MKLINSLGLMSGTSMDGIDASIIQTDGKYAIRTRFHLKIPYRKQTEIILNKIINNVNEYKDTRTLTRLITFDHAEAVFKLLKKSKIKPQIIGFHGQTIAHKPQLKKSLQLGDGKLLSKLTGITVVSNFRENDLKNGGQGAPIAPIYHKYLIESLNLRQPCCFINIGGVSNLTYLYKNNLIGFDVGPGNGLIDIFCQNFLKQPYDKNGNIAFQGEPIDKIIKSFLKLPFFKLTYPKSLDRLDFQKFLNKQNLNQYSYKDIIATLSQMTVQAIIESLKILPNYPEKIIIMGGGQNNNYLVHNLKLKANCEVEIADKINLPGDYIEAELMAYLAVRTLRKLPITFPLTTGVNKPCVGGIINYN